MNDLYSFFAAKDLARMFTLVLITLFGTGGVVWVRKNAHDAGVRLTSFGLVQFYIFGLIAFLSATLVVGFMIVPDNATALLELIHAGGIVDWMTSCVQDFMLYLIKSLM